MFLGETMSLIFHSFFAFRIVKKSLRRKDVGTLMMDDHRQIFQCAALMVKNASKRKVLSLHSYVGSL